LLIEDLDDAPEARGINRVTLASGAEHIEIVESDGQRAAHLGAENVLEQVFVFIPRNLTTDQDGLMVTQAIPQRRGLTVPCWWYLCQDLLLGVQPGSRIRFQDSAPVRLCRFRDAALGSFRRC